MWRYIRFKRAIKYLLSGLTIPTSFLLSKNQFDKVCILVYHRVSDFDFIDPEIDDWNVTPQRFDQHISALSESAYVITLADLPLYFHQKPAVSKPVVCITFDDGYSNFYSNVLPLLERYKTKTSLFVVTGSVGQPIPMPFDRWAMKNHQKTSPEAWRPINWDELKHCVDSGLVQIGSHSHEHLDPRKLNLDQLKADTDCSRNMLIDQLGEDQAKLFSYPFGSTRLGFVTNDYKSAVQKAGFQISVTTDLGLVGPDSDLFLLPRIEAHQLDTPSALLAKVSGAIHPLYLSDRLRKANRS